MSSGDTQQDGKGVQTFEDYDFESDNGWLNIVRRIDFTTQSEAKQKALLEKRKRKYFDKFVQSPDDSTAGGAESQSAEPASNSSNTEEGEGAGDKSPSVNEPPAYEESSPKEAKADESRVPPSPQPRESEKKTEPEAKSSDSTADSSSAQPQAAAQSMWTGRRKFIVPLNYLDWVFAIITVLATFSNFLPILFSGGASYRVALIAVLCSKFIGFILEIVKSDGAFHWRALLQLLQTSFNLQMAWGALMLLLLDPHSRLNLAFLVPSALRAAYFSVICARAVLQSFAPRLLENTRVESSFQYVTVRGVEMRRLAAELEVWNGIILVGMWLTPNRNLIATFMYWSGYLQRMYIFPGYGDMKAAFYNVKTNLNQVFFHQRCPGIIRTGYQKVCDLLYSFVDPARGAQAQQQGQRCVIM